MSAPAAAAASPVSSAVANTSRRDRTVGIAVLVALGIMLLVRYCRGRSGDAAARGGSRGVTAPDAKESSLPEKEAAAVRAAAGKYGEEYQNRMNAMVAPKDEDGARPFIGFSIADNILPGTLVVDGIFEKGPAFEVGVDIDHHLVAIAGEAASSVETVRQLVAKHCKPGRVTHFTFYDDDNNSQYEADVFVLTADERYRGKPYFFAPQEHEVRQSDRLKQTWRPGQTPDKASRPT